MRAGKFLGYIFLPPFSCQTFQGVGSNQRDESSQLLEKHYLADASADRGRFRAFLITAFKHFLSKERDKAKALKRGGGRPPISLDFASADSQICIEPASGLTAEQLYDKLGLCIALPNRSF